MLTRLLLCFAIACSVSFSLANAQLTSGISGPVVNEGKRAAGYRAAYDPDVNGLAQRIHYDHALNDKFLLRGVAQARKTSRSDLDFDFFQAELRWQLTPDSADWQQGLRFDVRIRDDDRPGLVAAHWMHQVQLAASVRVRFAAIISSDIGSDARDGIFLQTRGDLGWRLAGSVDVGAELYNSYGAVDDILPLERASHLAGPFVSLPLTNSLNLRTSALLGLTEASPDVTFRLFLTQDF
ncbi:hypothetical protein [Hyphomonas pacifica]|uniref:Alginate export domain-containing protein n=1 Tax=Hyphomonas pacifica TaxID=1280941 RepID=A0A062U2G6_9PROT|nr:hypothetical protein [Hyphomonas pacifica]KCZ50804.1 hypothetical protein HY2_13235 [Hyphomonas pacifica]RAN33317.1 hypothetical protein HY3_13305 [Hyphomonas pacifica]RAN36976.1 hypothetical protein HY11_10235 [Hyphomonas pacifica]